MSMFGISWRPSQPGKVSFNPKNIGFNDVLNAGSMFATGGLSGIGNVAKWGTANFAKNFTGANTLKGLLPKLGMVQGMTAQKGVGIPKAGTGAPGDYNAQLQALLAHMDSLGHDQLDFAQANEPGRQQAITSAAHALQPSGVWDSIARARNASIGGAYDLAAKGNAALNSQGMASQPGVTLDALNQAQSGANQNMYNQMAPSAVAARGQQLAQLLGSDSTAPDAAKIIQMLMGGQGLNNQNAQLQQSLRANRPASFLETLFATIGPLAGQYINAQQGKKA